MNVLEAIYKRRAVREYTQDQIDRSTVCALIEAAIQAPSADNRQPWAFAVIQDRELLAEISEHAKHFLREHRDLLSSTDQYGDLDDPEYNLFHGAGTLILICARPGNSGASGDCCLAAANLMLSATAMELGTCPIVNALPWIRSEEGRREFAIPEGYEPVLPIVTGIASRPAPPESRKAPKILSWRRKVEDSDRQSVGLST